MRRTTAVGMYSQGVSWIEAYDLCGNTLEWCLSPWDGEYEHHTPKQINLDDDVMRIWRGGAWSFDIAGSRSATRDGYTPDYRDTSTGFRICCLRPGLQQIEQITDEE